jgi:hypothetical protein
MASGASSTGGLVGKRLVALRACRTFSAPASLSIASALVPAPPMVARPFLHTQDEESALRLAIFARCSASKAKSFSTSFASASPAAWAADNRGYEADLGGDALGVWLSGTSIYGMDDAFSTATTGGGPASLPAMMSDGLVDTTPSADSARK